jgi:hypothetical protein
MTGNALVPIRKLRDCLPQNRRCNPIISLLGLLSEAFATVPFELTVKKTRLLKKIPGFAGYGSHHGQETDWQLRRYLAGELRKVGDRLADIIGRIPIP